MKPFLIFDFDGTIADTEDIFIETLNELSHHFHYKPIHKSELSHLKEQTAKEFAGRRLGIRFWKLPSFVLRLHTLLDTKMAKIRLFPEMERILQTLHREGYRMGIVSSNAEGLIREFLREQKLSMFEFVSSDGGFRLKRRAIKETLKKLHLNHQKTIYIGDEVRDIIAARHNVIKTIAVTWGFNSTTALKKSHPFRIADTPTKLLETITSLPL
jgi:phosphoglycolate phosphatase